MIIFQRIVIILFLFIGTGSNSYSQKMSGITMVAPPEPIDHKAIDRVVKTNAQWICFVPYGYHRQNETKVKYNIDWQWWGEKEEGLNKCISMAKDKGMKILVKPQVYIPGSWVGEMDFKTEKEWQEWEASYSVFINFFLDIAIKHDVEVFCIGTEYKIAMKKREKFWRKLIKDARQKYKGKIVYSSNWDNYQDIPIWDQLDYVGISAYFPLSEEATPTIKSLAKKWQPIAQELENFSKKTGKQILFTEYGYLTIDKCAYRAWELEKVIKISNRNENAQANAFAALYQTFADKSWWAGGYIWKWFPNGMGHEGYFDKDYTPQDKKAEEVIKVYFDQMNLQYP